MNIAHIIIGTTILWGLTKLCVEPLAAYWLKRKHEEPVYAHPQGIELPIQNQETMNRLATQYYILADVLVLSMAGFIGGLLGYWFVGIAFSWKGWPGMVAFVGGSLLGVALGTNLRAASHF